MTPKQRQSIIDALEHPGPGPIDAARMEGVALSDLKRDWLLGRKHASLGFESDEARFYLDAQAAMARVQSRLVGESHAASGSREASDLLQVAAHLRTLQEPFEDEEAGDVRAESPILSITDKIEVCDDPSERDRLQQVQATAEKGLLALFHEMTRPAEAAA